MLKIGYWYEIAKRFNLADNIRFEKADERVIDNLIGGYVIEFFLGFFYPDDGD